jgi:hypothetical protein
MEFSSACAARLKARPIAINNALPVVIPFVSIGPQISGDSIPVGNRGASYCPRFPFYMSLTSWKGEGFSQFSIAKVRVCPVSSLQSINALYRTIKI